ncbi:MAG: PepSY-associated TM helix domain-containing protein [Gemmatimonadota bacterium]
MTKAKAGKKRIHWRKLLFDVHGWMGLNLGLILYVVCLSGTFASLSDEFDAWLDPIHRIEGPPPPTGSPVDWDAMFLGLAQAFPDGRPATVSIPGASGYQQDGGRAAAIAFVAMPNGETRKVYLDPYTGEVRGGWSFFNLERFFRTFHRRLFDGSRGILLVTLTGFVLLLSCVTGFAFYRGWWEQARTLRFRGSARRRWSDLHKVVGFWGLVFGLLISVTGIYYFVEVVYQRADAYDQLLPPPMLQVDESSLSAFGPQPSLLAPSAYIASALDAYPELDVRGVRMPTSPTSAVYVDGRGGNPLTRDRADKVHLHPFTGEVIDVQRTSDLRVIPFMTDAVDPLHFGYFGGLVTQVLWFVLGLFLSFSILSGMYVWVVRSTQARKRPSRLMRGVPISVGVTMLYLGYVGIATVDGIQGYAADAHAPVPIGDVEVGAFRVRIDCGVPCAIGAERTISVRFLGEGMPNYESAELITAGKETVELRGPSAYPRGSLGPTAASPVSLRVVDRRGEVHAATLPPLVASTTTVTLANWPDTARGVWWFVAFFVTLLVASLGGWLWMVLRVARRSE